MQWFGKLVFGRVEHRRSQSFSILGKRTTLYFHDAAKLILCLVLCQLLLFTAMPARAVECGGEPGGVRITISEMFAIEVTETPRQGDRDEIFIRSSVRTPRGLFEGYSPLSDYDEDYYEFWKNSHSHVDSVGSWSNDDERIIYPPQIWEGPLPKDGDEVLALIALMEQDDTSHADAAAVIGTALGICQSASDSAAGVAGATKEDKSLAEGISRICRGGKELTGYMPTEDGHDFIGAALVGVMNNSGKLQVTFTAVDATAFGGDEAGSRTLLLSSDDEDPILILAEDALESGALFETSSPNHFGRYQFRVSVEPTCESDFEPRRKLWTDDIERGRCRNNQPVEILMPDNTRQPLRSGSSMRVATDGGWRVHYWCDGSEEPEGNLFEPRDYREFVVERTEDTIEYYPYTFLPYPEIGLRKDPLQDPREEPDSTRPFRLSREAGQARISWAPDKAAGATELSLCNRLVAETKRQSQRVPVIAWYSPGRGDNTATTHPSWMGCEGASRSPDYVFSRVLGVAYSPELPRPAGTVPLYRWYSPDRDDNWTTTNHAELGQRQAGLSPDYQFSRLVGYIYPPSIIPGPEHVPLYSWWSPSREDNWATTLHAEAGQKGEGLSPDYEFVRLEGYLLRAE